jgi:hypothetical protein
MLDTLFWCTGLIAWIFIVFGLAAMLYYTARVKAVLKRISLGHWTTVLCGSG